MKKLTRRRFLRRAAISSAALPFLGRHASLAADSRVLGANDDIRVAIVGVGSSVKIGGQGKNEIRNFRKIPGVRVVALCDVDRAHLDAEVEKLNQQNVKVETYTDIRYLLENKDIDAVSITTPNHWHALATIWACQAGKDVFVQKPASHNIFEGRKMVEAARRYDRIVQCFSGSRSPTGFREAVDYARQGRLGKIQYVHGVNYKPRPSIGKVAGPRQVPKTLDYDQWSGPAPVKPLMREYLHYDWHWDWLTGNGDLGNMGIHNLEGCRMAVGQDRLPRRVMCIGGRFGYVDDGQTPNTQIVFLDYEPAPIIFEVRGLPRSRSEKIMDVWHGVQIGVVIHCENGYVAANKAFDRDGKLIEEFPPTGPDLNANFIECVRSRRAGDLRADIQHGHLGAALVHMGNISYRLGRTASSDQIIERIRGHKELLTACERFRDHLAANGVDLEKTPATLGPMLTMDPDTERFVGEFSAEANKLISREYRKPYVVPAQI